MSKHGTISALFVLAASALPAAAAEEPAVYTNPVIDVMGMADPHVIRHEGVYYLYPTHGGKGYDVFTSRDLVHWEPRGRCFDAPRPGAWAPDVFRWTHDGKFYLYYTVDAHKPLKQIGVAVADSPLGPFQDRGVLVKNAIDAHLFENADGALYLYYVQLPNAEGRPVLASRLRVQPMADPLHAQGDSHVVIAPEAPWEKVHFPVTEAPWMFVHGGRYYLMYSGSHAATAGYAIGYATAESPLGPFTKHPGNPIAHSGRGVFGPGHHCVVEGPNGGLWMVYHQKDEEPFGWRRFIALDPLRITPDGVIEARVSRGAPQPAP